MMSGVVIEVVVLDVDAADSWVVDAFLAAVDNV